MGEGKCLSYRALPPCCPPPSLGLCSEEESWTENTHILGVPVLSPGNHWFTFLLTDGEGEAQRGEVTCRRMHRMSGRAGVRADMTSFPGQCFVHTGCHRIRTDCQRSLREQTERSGLTREIVPGPSHTPRSLPGLRPTDFRSSLPSSSLHGPLVCPASCSTSPGRAVSSGGRQPPGTGQGLPSPVGTHCRL